MIRAPARVFLAGGGTGGHITPALATAAAIRDLRPDIEVEFVGTARGMESRLVPAAGWVLHEVDAVPLRRSLSLDTVRAPLAAARAALLVRRLLRQRGAVAACAFGGYTAGPLALAARLSGVPLVLHEQNAVPGLANRIAARWARTVAVSVEAAVPRFPRRDRVVVTGNPVRPELAHAALGSLAAASREAFALEPGRLTLLVFGGSLGAQRINDALLGTADRWPEPGSLQILHVAGGNDHERVARRWETTPTGDLLVRCVPFVDRMELAYAAADVVVARAGASTVAEVTLAGLPAVLVPYPHATGDHQTANARALADAGAATMVADGALDGQVLVDAVASLLRDPVARAAMVAAARSLARPDAARRLAQLVLAAAGERLPACGAQPREDGRHP